MGVCMMHQQVWGTGLGAAKRGRRSVPHALVPPLPPSPCLQLGSAGAGSAPTRQAGGGPGGHSAQSDAVHMRGQGRPCFLGMPGIHPGICAGAPRLQRRHPSAEERRRSAGEQPTVYGSLLHALPCGAGLAGVPIVVCPVTLGANSLLLQVSVTQLFKPAAAEGQAPVPVADDTLLVEASVVCDDDAYREACGAIGRGPAHGIWLGGGWWVRCPIGSAAMPEP